MLLTRFATSQIQLFSSIFNLFKFNSTSVTNIQFNLFNFKAFSTNSTILRPNHKFPQPPAPPCLSVSVCVSVHVHNFNDSTCVSVIEQKPGGSLTLMKLAASNWSEVWLEWSDHPTFVIWWLQMTQSCLFAVKNSCWQRWSKTWWRFVCDTDIIGFGVSIGIACQKWTQLALLATLFLFELWIQLPQWQVVQRCLQRLLCNPSCPVQARTNSMLHDDKC